VISLNVATLLCLLTGFALHSIMCSVLKTDNVCVKMTSTG